MKQVKNKITGDIAELDIDSREGTFIVVRYDLHTKETIKEYYKNLEDLCEEWEDYEEPKEFWYIGQDGVIFSDTDMITQDYADRLQEIGNYFETKEEAEKAVKKLEALAILDKFGFRFIDWEFDMKTVADGKIWFDIGTNTEWNAEQLLKLKPKIKESLDILFGGEE